MKLLALGAGGVMGGNGIKVLQNFPGIEEITIADLYLEKAENLAKELNFPKVSAIQLDVTDTKKLTELARKYDLVFNAVGPFITFGVPTLKAIIEAGTDYIDVCDEGDASAELLKLNGMAKEAGVTALIGMGQTPGIANMQAKYVAERLDSVDNLLIAWSSGMPDIEAVRGTDLEQEIANWIEILKDAESFKAVGKAGWDHMVHSCTGNIPVWKNGKFDTVPAWESGIYVDFAEHLGRVPVFFVGHAEPSTLPHYIDIKNFCACLGNMYAKELRLEARGHEEPLNPPVMPDTPLWTAPDAWKGLSVWQAQAAIAEGWKDGKKVRLTNRFMCSTFDRGAYTFGGQAIGIYLLGQMKDKPKGVFAPEGIFETDLFFETLTRLLNRMNGWDMTPEELVPTQCEEIENGILDGVIDN
ncbi:MAG: saccharopine dehydrogenase family protein [Saccharofermentanales bacterium]|jgi:saccharopine dehydrogenase-like NADP-dependent oxidoreductase